MLSPGDQVLLDGQADPASRWTVIKAQSVPNGKPPVYKLRPTFGNDPSRWVSAAEITSHWVET